MTEEYGIKEMVGDFVNPAQYMKTSELADKGVLTIVSAVPDVSEEYGKSFKTTLEDVNGEAYLSYISAKQPYSVFEQFGPKLKGCKVQFNVVKLDTKKTIVKMVLKEQTEAFKEAYAKFVKDMTETEPDN